MRKKNKQIGLEKIIADSFLRKGYFYTDSSYMARLGILKLLPSDVLCTTVVSNIYGSFVILDVSRIESIIKEDDVYSISMKDDPFSSPLLLPAASFSISNISDVLKRLERYDLLLKI